MTVPELQLTRIINGSVEDVFAAWTDPAVMARWWGPSEHLSEAETDPRPGGSYRLAMRSADGRRLLVTGTYREVDPPNLLVFSWRWEEGVPDLFESIVTVRLSPFGEYTQLELTHTGFPDDEAAQPYGQGWEASLGKLERLFGEGSK